MHKELLENITNCFDKEDRKLALAELASIKLSHVMANSEHNLNDTRFAILKLAKGNIKEVIELTKAAKIDFRDVIMWAMEENDKELMNEAITKHSIKGKVYIWKYKENAQNYPGWNFTVDAKASKNLIELLKLMSLCEGFTSKIISTKSPTELQLKVPNNKNGKAKWETKKRLILTYKTTESENSWLVSESENKIEIEFGKAKLTELKNAIAGIPEGNGDFAIADKKRKNILYFWWNLDN